MLFLELLLFLLVALRQLLLLASVLDCHRVPAPGGGMLSIHFRLLGRLPLPQLLALLLLTNLQVTSFTRRHWLVTR